MTRLLPLLVLLLAAPARVHAEEEPAPEASAAVTAEMRDQAIRRAFAYLDEHMWRLSEGTAPEKEYAVPVAGWAYLLAADRAEGKRLPSRTRELKRIRDYLERMLERAERVYAKAAREGRKRPRPSRGAPPGMSGVPPGFDLEAMQARQFTWTLSMAGLFFAESHGRGKNKRASKGVLKRIATVLESAQQESGGWGHDDARLPGFGLPKVPIPKPGGGSKEHDYPVTLLAATNCAASALGAAHRVLGTKDTPAIARAIEYYRAAQHASGTFPYDPSQRRGELGVPGDEAVRHRIRSAAVTESARTGGALFALHCLGLSPDDEMGQAAVRILDESVEVLSEGHGSATMALQFGALVSRARGDTAWAAFRDVFFPRILAAQQEDGSFDCVCRHGAGVTCDSQPAAPMLAAMGDYMAGKRVYVTALHVLILLLDRTPSRAVPPFPEPQSPVTPR